MEPENISGRNRSKEVLTTKVTKGNSVISNMTVAQILDAIHNVYTKDVCLRIEKEFNALLRFEPVRRKIIYDNSSLTEQINMDFELLPEWEQDYILAKINNSKTKGNSG